jgi:katanin p60 ATPase-containing subunit A1
MQISKIDPKSFPNGLLLLTLELLICRECALLGNYDVSLLYFEALLKSIQTFTKTLDKEEQSKWMETLESLTKEFETIKEINSTLNSFKTMTKQVDNWQEPEPKFPKQIRKKMTLEEQKKLPSWARSSPKPISVQKTKRSSTPAPAPSTPKMKKSNSNLIDKAAEAKSVKDGKEYFITH